MERKTTIHSFRLSAEYESYLLDNKKILASITNIPEYELTDTQVINFCLRRIHEDYYKYLD